MDPKLIRTLVYIEQNCNECKKELKKEEVAWVFIENEKEVKGLISKPIKYYCVPCGNKIIEQDKSPQKMSGEICFAPNCKNKIKKEYFQCQDSQRKFCSQGHFEEVYGLHCPSCGKEIAERVNYLEKVRLEKTVFQKTLPWLLGFLVILIIVIMIILLRKEEKRKFRSANLY